jgi:hypothetical protein
MPRSPLLSLVLLTGLVPLGACGEKDTKLKVTGLEVPGSRAPSGGPEQGDVEGGTYIIIKGNRFTADGPRNAKVYFGSRQGTVVRFANDHELVVQAPGGKQDEIVDVKIIFEPGGELTIKNAFKFIDKSDVAPTVDDLNTAKDKKK